MRAGEMRHRVTIFRPVIQRDASGQAVEEEPTAIGSAVPAKIEAVSGGETRRGKQVDATATHLVTIRYRTGIQTTDFFLWGARRLNLVGSPLDRDGRTQWLDVQCKEAV